MNTIRSEFIKLRTIRSPWILTIVAVGFPLLVAFLSLALMRVYDVNLDTLPAILIGTSMVSVLLVGVIGVLSITNDFNYNTIRPTFAATPNRNTVYLAKAAVVAAWAAAIQGLILVVGWGLGALIADSRDITISLSDVDTTTPAFIGLMFLAIGYGLIGVGLGAILRSQAGSISVLAVFPVVAEPLIVGLLNIANLEGVARHLPFRSGFAMVQLDPKNDLDISRISGAVGFWIFVIVIVALGAVVLNRRDA